MKKFLILCTLMISGASIVLSQDILVLKNGDEIESKITEIGINEIKYKKHSLPDGPDYVCLKSDVFMIKFKTAAKKFLEIPAPHKRSKPILREKVRLPCIFSGLKNFLPAGLRSSLEPLFLMR